MNFENPEQLEDSVEGQELEQVEQPTEQEPENPEGDSLELGPEKKRVMEDASKERSGVLNKYMSSEVVSTGLNFVPYVGGPKMLHESIVGREMSGKELSGVKRVIHGGVGAASMTLDFAAPGSSPSLRAGAMAAKLEGESALVMGKVAEAFKNKGDEKNGRVFERTGRFMADHPEETAEAEQYGDKRIRDSQTLLQNPIE